MNKFFQILVALLAFVICTPTYASVIQYFWGNTYNNPASLNSTKNYSITSGLMGVFTKVYFSGTGAGGQTGNASSSTYSTLPYLTMSTRIGPKWVAGINLSQPYFADENFPQGSVVQFDSTQTISTNYDINPQVSYLVNDKLVLGAGLNINRYQDFQTNFVTPGVGNTVNYAQAWSYGWDIGLFYTINPTNYLSIAYFSKLSPNLQGKSTSGMLTSSNLKVTGIVLPATTTVDYITMLKTNWLLSLKLLFSQWSNTSSINFVNVAGYANTLAFPVNYKNTFAFELFTKYDLSQKYSALGGFIYDQGAATDKTRTVAYSTDDLKVIFLGMNTQISKEMGVQGTVGYGFYNTELNRPFNVFPTVGNMQVRGTVAALKFTYNC